MFASIVGMSLTLLNSCALDDPQPDDLIIKDYTTLLQPGDSLYHLNDFVKTFMTETGNKYDTDLYRQRSIKTINGENFYMFSVDTIREDGPGIWIKGRVSTDDYGGNFYKSLIIQEIVNGRQQNLRLSIDLGSASGMYPLGQEIMIRCNGLSIGRYANQPQLCVPSYDNGIYKMNATEKIGWCPGRIPAARFKEVCYCIGLPDASQLQYDIVTWEDIYLSDSTTLTYKPNSGVFYNEQAAIIRRAREEDGRLVKMVNMHCTREIYNYDLIQDCDTITADPALASNACTFAPTTQNKNFPQGRLFATADDNASTKTSLNRRVISVSTSEYAKYARYILPEDIYSGTITGILSFYQDKGSDETGMVKWSISPRNLYIDGTLCTLNDIQLFDEDGNEWKPLEWTPYNIE